LCILGVIDGIPVAIIFNSYHYNPKAYPAVL